MPSISLRQGVSLAWISWITLYWPASEPRGAFCLRFPITGITSLCCHTLMWVLGVGFVKPAPDWLGCPHTLAPHSLTHLLDLALYGLSTTLFYFCRSSTIHTRVFESVCICVSFHSVVTVRLAHWIHERIGRAGLAMVLTCLARAVHSFTLESSRSMCS